MAKPKTLGPRGHGASRKGATGGKTDEQNARQGIGTARGGWRQNGRKVQQKTQGDLTLGRRHALRTMVVDGEPHPNAPGPRRASAARGDTKLPAQPQDTDQGQESER